MKQSKSSKQTRMSTLLWSISRSQNSACLMSAVYAILLTLTCLSVALADQASSSDNHQAASSNSIEESSKSIPANHRSESEDEVGSKSKLASRQSRQYDNQMSSSSAGSYAALSGEGSAYVSQMPLGGSNYGSGSADLSASYPQAGAMYHDPLAMARGYAAPPMGPQMHHSPGYPQPVGLGSTLFSASGMSAPGGLLSSSMFPLMSKGFDVSEIVCTAIAVAIGAVIVGAPFILIYLFIMNQMNGNGPSLGPSGGAISLTGPNSSTSGNGRKKRHTSLPEALFKQLSPLVNSEQVASTFKALMNSIAKYQM